MRTLLFCLFFAFTSLSCCFSQEIKLMFDSKGKLETIDNSLNNMYHFFPEYEYLHQANLYQLADSSISLEIEYQKEGKMLRSRKVLSINDLILLRQQIDNQLLQPVNKPIDQTGRVPLIVFSSAIGLSCYSWMLPTALDVNDGKAFLSLYLLTAASSFFVPYLATRDEKVSLGMAKLTNFGLGFGLAHGALFANIFTNKPDDSQPILFSALGFGLLEGIGFYHLAKNKQFTNGQSSAMVWYSNYGALFTVGSAYVLGNSNNRFACASTLLGAAGGFGLGYYLSHKQNYTQGDVIFSSAATGIAVFNTTAILYVAESDDPKVYVTGALVSSAASAIWSHYYTRDRDYKTSNAIYIALGGAGGGLIGAGIGVLVSPTNSDGKATMLLAAAGSTAGFFLTNSLLKNDNETKAVASKFNLSVNPAAIFTAKRSYNPTLPGGGIIPLVNARYTF